jgi:hypothetical protein
MTIRSSLQNSEPDIHSAHCRCKRCAPISLSGDPRGFGKPVSGFSQYLPDVPAALVMLGIGIPALIIHLVLFS